MLHYPYGENFLHLVQPVPFKPEVYVPVTWEYWEEIDSLMICTAFQIVAGRYQIISSQD